MYQMTLTRLTEADITLTYEEFTQAINALVRLKKTVGPKLPSYRQGICFNWQGLLNEMYPGTTVNSYLLVSYLAMDWPETTNPGNVECYPIIYLGHPWEGKNLRLRLSLIDFLLKRLRALKKQLRVQTERASPHR